MAEKKIDIKKKSRKTRFKVPPIYVNYFNFLYKNGII